MVFDICFCKILLLSWAIWSLSAFLWRLGAAIFFSLFQQYSNTELYVSNNQFPHIGFINSEKVELSNIHISWVRVGLSCMPWLLGNGRNTPGNIFFLPWLYPFYNFLSLYPLIWYPLTFLYPYTTGKWLHGKHFK